LEHLIWVWTIVKVMLGLGFVIFIHELGHFILAKWNGVKVEKFSIGFGKTLFGFTRGETEYVVAALPLGGFVKMLGEGTEELASTSNDPRAYPNKSVGARMAIISAGVIMNVLLAYACFVFFFQHERVEGSSALGAVAAGSPAYEAGLRPGDDILAVDDLRNVGYTSVRLKVLMSSHGQILHLEVKRPGYEDPIGLDIEPRREATADAPAIGIVASDSLEISDFRPMAGMQVPPTYPHLKPKERESKVDVLVAAGPAGQAPEPVADIFAYDRLLAKYAEEPIQHVIERRELSPTGEHGQLLERFELTVPACHFVDFGLRLGLEPIKAIRKDSPAEKAGFRTGDQLIKVDGRDDFDPVRLPALCYRNAGKPMTFEIEREVAAGERTRETLRVTPDDTPPRTKFAIGDEAVDVPGIGFCYPIKPQVAAVRPDSPAARAGLKPGDTINSLSIPPPPARKESEKSSTWWPLSIFKSKKAERPQTYDFSDHSSGWLAAFLDLQNRPIQKVELTVNKRPEPIKITPVPDLDWLDPTRGLHFYPQTRKLPPQALGLALGNGYDETIRNVSMVYSTFRSLAQKQVSPKNLGGPILIAQVAYAEASSGFTEFVRFLGVLSINLAVLNFLPIPPLDGGQMVFLIAEKVRGRPLPDSAVLGGTYFGLLLVLCLMVYVTYQDVFRLFKAWF
jgi:regulator of sigma E protease